MRNKTQMRSKAGFSLIEVTLALAIMAIGLLAIVGMLPHGIQSSRDAADNTLAATIANDTFTQIRTYALANPWPLALPPDLVDTNYDMAGTNAVFSSSPDRYFHVHVSTLLPTPSLLTAIVVISWPAKSATPIDNLTNVTQIANYQQ